MSTGKVNLQMAGRFKFVAHKKDGSSRVLADWFDNLILDTGLERLGTGGVLGRCAVGADSTMPAVGQTALLNFIASTTTINAIFRSVAEDQSYVASQYVYRFAEGVAAGNLSEVGVGWADEAMFSRALIKDDFGDPTTITVLSDELLDVIYEVRVYPDLSDKVFNVDISGTTYEFTLRPVAVLPWVGIAAANHGYWGYELSEFLTGGFVSTGGSGATAQPFSTNATLREYWQNSNGGTSLGGYVSASRSFITAYEVASLERKIRYTFGLDQGLSAFGGISFYSRCGSYQTVIDPPIPKDHTKVLTLDLTFSWGRKT